jgi:type I site-specific restriction endonuclease
MDDLEIIFSYTRQEAIEDGVLIDVSGTAVEVGIKISSLR